MIYNLSGQELLGVYYSPKSARKHIPLRRDYECKKRTHYKVERGGGRVGGANFVFAATLQREGVVRRSVRMAGVVEPSMEVTRTKKGILRLEDGTNEYISWSIFDNVPAPLSSRRVDQINQLVNIVPAKILVPFFCKKKKSEQKISKNALTPTPTPGPRR
jgi:hypothetical protein